MTNHSDQIPPMSRRESGSDGRLVDCVGLIVCGAVVAWLLRPLQNTPFIDDFTYAWSVEWLRQHHQLRILEWSANLNITQVLWGWLFCLPGGFSFTALRLSTLVLAWSGLCAFYLLLRELQVARRDALVGTGLLGVNPVFFMLGFTFMTDVPFLVLLLWSCYTMVRALRQQSDRWLLLSVGVACLAAGTRATAAPIPVAMMIALVFHSQGWGRQRGRFLWPVAALLVLAFWISWRTGHTVASADVSDLEGSPADRMRGLRYAIPLLPRMLLVDSLFAATMVGWSCLPLALACIRKRGAGRALMVLGGFGALVLLAHRLGVRCPDPLSTDSTWSLVELGGTEGLVPGYLKPTWPGWWGVMIWLVGLSSAAVLVARVRGQETSPGAAFLLWMTAGQFLLLAVLWLIYDRYALTLVPLSIALVLASHPPLRWARAGPVILGLAVVSFIGVRDHLAYNRALWQGVDELRRQGAADAEIDGGYVVNGWLQYAHPEHAPRDAQGRILVTWFNTHDSSAKYLISNSPTPARKLLATIPYRRWLGRSGCLYLYER